MFNARWFPKKVFEAHLSHLKTGASLRILEIGAFEGYGTTYFLENYLSDSGSIVCVDPFLPYSESTIAKIPGVDQLINEGALGRFLENTQKWSDRITLIKGFSQHVLPLLSGDAFDLIFVDGDHSCDAVAQDGRESFRLAKSGGYIVFDDYRWGADLPRASRPRDAVDQFLKHYADRISLVHKGSEVVVRKN